MAYKINNTFGTLLVTLADGTIDVATTDLTLIGKGYAGFGEKLNENLVKLLENFNNTSAPANKIQGQLWYDKTNNQLNVYTGTKFKPVGSTTNSATAPTNAVLGDMWFDTANTQLYIYTGTAWTLIGPTTVSGSGVTQVVSEAIEDNVGVQKSILRFVTNDTNVAIVSAEEFTPGTSISGFATIKKGITLSSAISGNKLEGTSTDSDALGGVAAANYLRSNANDTTSGTLGVLNDDGITIGSGSDITMKLSSDDFTIAQTTQDKDIIFTVNDGGSTTEVMRLDGANSTLKVKDLEVTGTQTIFNTTKLTVEDNIIEVNRNISNAAAMPNFSGLKINRGATSTVTEQDLYWVWDETFADEYGFMDENLTDMRLPDYQIFDMGASYRFKLFGDDVRLRLNVNNVFDEEYYPMSTTNYPVTPTSTNHNGINVDNKVFPGWGRTWNLGFTYRF